MGEVSSTTIVSWWNHTKIVGNDESSTGDEVRMERNVDETLFERLSNFLIKNKVDNQTQKMTVKEFIKVN